MNNTLVISRYTENLKWIDLTQNINCIIYNKGPKNISLKNNHTIINVPNIDNEGYVYVKYIVDNYDNLPDQVIFSQGNPFDHSQNFLSLINLHTQKFNSIQPLTQYYKPNEIYNKYTKFKTECLHINHIPIHIEFYDNTYHYIKDIAYKNTGTLYVFNKLNDMFKNTDIVSSIMNFVNIKSRYKIIPFCFAAIFAVSKSKILSHPKEYYIDLLDKCLFIHKKYHPKTFGWIMEYSWMEIFQYEAPCSLYPPILFEHFFTNK